MAGMCSQNAKLKPRAVMPRGVLAALFAAAMVQSVWGQVFTLTKEQLIQYTPGNPYDRFPDGRPKVPDAILEKVKEMSAEEVLGLNQRGYRNQYEAGWQILHPNVKMVGRAVTLQLMPLRPDVSDIDQAARRAKSPVRLSHQTAIDILQKGDVFVADAAGAQFGGVIGDNLAYYIWKTTGVGFVIDGAIRDLEGISPMSSLGGYYRAAVPPAIHDLMVTGINVPVRIGNATVMPGDVVFGDKEGVYFIPPSQVKAIVDEADVTHIHDEWTKKKFDEGKYISTDIYGSPHDPALQKEYQDYLKQKMGAQAYDEYMKNRPQGRAGRGGPPRQ
jgi:regulator of RNase E activity RraA